MSCVYDNPREGEAELVLDGVDIKEGNISLLLDEAEEKEYLDTGKVLRTIPTGFWGCTDGGKYTSEFSLPTCRV